MLIVIAWRNIWRNKTRSLVVMAAITFGLWGGIFSYGFMNGMGNQQIYSAIHVETGHIQVNQPNFLLNYDLQSNIPNGQGVEEKISQIKGIKSVTERIQLTAMASTGYSSSGIVLNGIDISSFQKVSELDNYLTKGNFFTEKNNNAVVIGEQLAEKLHADIHSKITLTLQDYSGNYIKQDVTVEGIYKLSNSEFNEQMMFINKQDLQKVISFPDGNISTITILLNDDADTKRVQGDIKKQYAGMQVQSWQELSPMLQIMSGTISQTTSIFVFIILLALSFSIINTMLMAVMDRTREIGMLLCIGMSRRKVFGMIVLETLFLSLTGAMLGLAISIGTIYYFGKKGIDLSFISEGINAIGYSSHIYPVIDNDFYPQFACMVIFIALVSSFFPAKRAIKLNPAEAVRGE